jgi:hypothetical protein
VTPEEQALRDLWMAELWKPCHELPRHVRALDRARAAARNDVLAERRSS